MIETKVNKTIFARPYRIMLAQIKYLIAKDVLLEWRQKYAFFSILLYVTAAIYVCYLVFHTITDTATWNALFWVLMLFASVNTAGKSFVHESRGKQLFYYTLVKPQAIILSKTIYNNVLTAVIALLSYLVYSLLIGNPVENQALFLLTLLLGSMGFSSVLTSIAAIASKTDNNTTLMAILSFPLLMPLFITVVKASRNAIEGLGWSFSYHYLLVLLLINGVVVLLSYLLFPYLWRD